MLNDALHWDAQIMSLSTVPVDVAVCRMWRPLAQPLWLVDAFVLSVSVWKIEGSLFCSMILAFYVKILNRYSKKSFFVSVECNFFFALLCTIKVHPVCVSLQGVSCILTPGLKGHTLQQDPVAFYWYYLCWINYSAHWLPTNCAN